MDQDITVLHDIATFLVSVITFALQFTLFQNPRVFLRKWLMKAFSGFYLVLFLLCSAYIVRYIIRLYMLYAGVHVPVFIGLAVGIVLVFIPLLILSSTLSSVSTAILATFSMLIIIVVELFLLYLHGVFPSTPLEYAIGLLIILSSLFLFSMLPRIWILKNISSMLGNKVSDEALMNRLVVYVMMFSFKDVFMEFYYPLEVAINELNDYVKG